MQDNWFQRVTSVLSNGYAVVVMAKRSKLKTHSCHTIQSCVHFEGYTLMADCMVLTALSTIVYWYFLLTILSLPSSLSLSLPSIAPLSPPIPVDKLKLDIENITTEDEWKHMIATLLFWDSPALPAAMISFALEYSGKIADVFDEEAVKLEQIRKLKAVCGDSKDVLDRARGCCTRWINRDSEAPLSS